MITSIKKKKISEEDKKDDMLSKRIAKKSFFYGAKLNNALPENRSFLLGALSLLTQAQILSLNGDKKEALRLLNMASRLAQTQDT